MMIKSERAKQWAKRACFDDDGMPRRATLFDIKRAVELAEEDAEARQKAQDREKAILSYCVVCGLSCCEGYFDNGNSCDRSDLDVFLSRYDNG
jgi:hypothetical protein